MFTILIEGVDPRPDDVELVAAITKASNPVPAVGARLLIGMINEDGLLYRAIQCEDMTELYRVGDALRAHGFVSEVAQGSYAQRGFRLMYDRVPKMVVPSYRPGGHRSRRR